MLDYWYVIATRILILIFSAHFLDRSRYVYLSQRHGNTSR